MRLSRKNRHTAPIYGDQEVSFKREIVESEQQLARANANNKKWPARQANNARRRNREVTKT